MPFIESFKGLRYNVKRVRKLSRVVTPPYDVITPEGQERHYRRHPWNFVRVVFGKNLPADTTRRNRYSRAQKTLNDWIDAGILQFDPAPSVYPYLQEYRLEGKLFQRWGVVALVRLDSPKIYPHEGTQEEPKRDRLELLSATRASLSPIFGLIPDEKKGYEKLIQKVCWRHRPMTSIRVDGVAHRLWRVSDPVWIKKISQLLRPRDLIIADGHHRFEAALEYARAQGKKNPEAGPLVPCNFAMFYLAASGKKEPGLLPTHRLVHALPPGRLESFLSGIGFESTEKVGDVRQMVRRLKRLQSEGRIGVGLTSGNGASFLMVAPRRCGYEMDVEWLHGDILPRLLGKKPQVSYTQDLAQALLIVRQKKARILFIVQRPSLDLVVRRARSRSRMPGKTTYFYPKPLAGLVEYKF